MLRKGRLYSENIEKYFVSGASGFAAGFLTGLLLAGMKATIAVIGLEKMFVLSRIDMNQHMRWTHLSKTFGSLLFANEAFILCHFCSLVGLVLFLAFTFLKERRNKRVH